MRLDKITSIQIGDTELALFVEKQTELIPAGAFQFCL
jgi:hypothetical protein